VTLSPLDERFLERTLVLAERGRRTASPNPVVGCVIARGERVLGEGWHVRPGERHAETNALAACSESPRGATAYVSLEPCSHHGRQPPCADALIAAGIARVVSAAGDPSRRVGGKGYARLRAAGIEVDEAEGDVERAARRQNAAFRVHATSGRPYVLLKLAASLDGRTATRSGESRWISSAESRRLVHEWRASMDAVAVGIGTALVDDPALTARALSPPAGRQPLRVVFDRGGRLPAGSTLARTAGDAPVLRIAPADAPDPPPAVERLDAGSAAEALRLLGRRRITSLLVEGGPTLAAGLLRDGLVDSLAVFYAPLLLGDGSRPLIGDLGVAQMQDAVPLVDLRAEQVGPDTLLRAETRRLP
jgi:diaminohydroxyphosphoribosylaminopyrimidine deaminase/5-amino-6-(5-phosphoribosylamino)uracil reductase